MNVPQTALTQRLSELGERIRPGNRIWIIPHDYPDPDALASACAVHLLLDKVFGAKSEIVFSGSVSRAENKELLRRIRYSWRRVPLVSPPRREVDCVLVDTVPWASNVTIPPYVKPVAVFDHHDHVRKAPTDLFMDVRSGTGATTTIVHEYLKTAGVEIPSWLAAIMAYAISSETLDMSREFNRQDIYAYLDLAARADLSLIGKIRHAPLPRVYYAHLQEALANARLTGRMVYSHLSRIEQPEIVAEVADLLLRMEGPRWAFCTAYLNGGMFVSIRSSARNAKCSKILRAVMGKKGSSGGHDSMAAGYMDMSMYGPEEKEERRQVLLKGLIRRILKKPASDPLSAELGAELLVDVDPS
ncbi:MAG TPA: DHH family phosphoesterase [Kiritimatiellia bacterium]|nr:DHH family phosphoesterase [Kiritimatiellia bacterium]